MKTNLYIAALIAGSIGAIGNSAMATQISYSSANGADIIFNGTGGFSFTSPGPDLTIQSGSAFGDSGTISGSYQIGTISTSGGTSTASVTGSGVLTIVDGLQTLTANLTWVDIVQNGTGSTLNDTGAVNLSNVTYGGSNVDLLALATAINDSDTLDFTFIQAQSLSTIASTSESTTFSGTIATVPDGGTTAMLLGAGLSGLALLKRKMVA
jgi:hypothetical protein